MYIYHNLVKDAQRTSGMEPRPFGLRLIRTHTFSTIPGLLALLIPKSSANIAVKRISDITLPQWSLSLSLSQERERESPRRSVVCLNPSPAAVRGADTQQPGHQPSVRSPDPQWIDRSERASQQGRHPHKYSTVL